MESLLTTIAACAATIIAIIGGFITTKLISLSSERKEADIKLKDIGEEIKHHKTEIKRFRGQLIENEAILIIGNNFEEFINGFTSIAATYHKRPSKYTLEEIKPYFLDAIATLGVFREALIQAFATNEFMDENGIPLEFSKALTPFTYEICRCAAPTIAHKIKLDQFNAGMYPSHGAPINYCPENPKVWVHKVVPYVNVVEAESEIASHQEKLNILLLQEKQIKTHRAGVEVPKSTIAGLVVFLCYAVVSVMFPIITLAFLPICNTVVEMTLKVLNIAFFVLGFAATVIYLVKLLKDKKPKKEGEK